MSVCPSVTRRYCVETAKHITNFLPLGSHTILVEPHQTLWQYSDGNDTEEGHMERQQKLVYDPSNGAISNDLE